MTLPEVKHLWLPIRNMELKKPSDGTFLHNTKQETENLYRWKFTVKRQGRRVGLFYHPVWEHAPLNAAIDHQYKFPTGTRLSRVGFNGTQTPTLGFQREMEEGSLTVSFPLHNKLIWICQGPRLCHIQPKEMKMCVYQTLTLVAPFLRWGCPGRNIPWYGSGWVLGWFYSWSDSAASRIWTSTKMI